jgi:two-component system sensor histidine kinase KdpD
VSGAVEVASRRARAAERAREEADTLSSLARPERDEEDAVRAVLSRARDTFSMESVALKRRDRGTGDWTDVESVGWAPPGEETALQFDVPVGRDMRMVGRGPALFAEDHRVLHAFAGAALSAYEGRQLGQREKEARDLANVDRQRTALLAAVGHDLRTPLAGIKASVSTLRQTDVDWSDEERQELLATIEGSADRLDAVVRNLLDASRLQAGMLTVQAAPVALDEVVSAAILAIPAAAGGVTVSVPEDLPMVEADPGLLERVLVNLLDNALRYGASERPVEVVALAGQESAKMAIVDHGPGISPEDEAQLFEPFRRMSDENTSGVGLGLTVARGFVEAMGGWMAADKTDGGGLTIRLRLPLAPRS